MNARWQPRWHQRTLTCSMRWTWCSWPVWPPRVGHTRWGLPHGSIVSCNFIKSNFSTERSASTRLLHRWHMCVDICSMFEDWLWPVVCAAMFIAPAAKCATHSNQLGQEWHALKSIASTCAAATAPASHGDQWVLWFQTCFFLLPLHSITFHYMLPPWLTYDSYRLHCWLIHVPYDIVMASLWRTLTQD